MPEITVDALMRRINRLELDMKDLEAQEKSLADRKQQLQGKLDEIWSWLNAYKNDGEFGEHMQIGQLKPTVRLPTFGDREKLEAAIEQRGKSVAGYDEKGAREVRAKRAQTDAQAAVDEIVKMPENDWPWLPEDKSPQP